MAEELKKFTWRDFFELMYFPIMGFMYFFGFSILVVAFGMALQISSFSYPKTFPVTPEKQIIYIFVIIMTNLVLMSPLLLSGEKRRMFSWEKLGLKPLVIDWQKVWKIVLIGAGLVVLETITYIVLEHLGVNVKVTKPSPIQTIVSNNFFLYMYFVLFLGIIGPIMEEIYFRGFFYGWLRRFFIPWVGILISSAVYGLLLSGSYFSICFGFVVGIIAAYLYERDKTLVSSIVFHITVNTLVYLVNFYAPKF